MRERSRALVRAEAQKNFNAALTFWADDAVVHFEGTPAITGHQGIRQAYEQGFQPPLVDFDATITHITVARSGELAYETGVNHFTFERAGQRVPETGKYLAVWRRVTNGDWLLAAVAVTNDRRPQ